jgi:hypothetical protein
MRVLFGVALLAVCASAQSLDLSSLDKLEAKAKEVNTVSLDAGQIRGAMNLLPGDDQDMQKVRDILSGIHNISVRNFEFEEKGAYSMADVDAIRAQIARMPGWAKIVESREAEEHDEVYLLTQSEKIGGLAVIAAEPRELTVVFINGSVSLKDLGKLHGMMGIPDIELSDKGHTDKDTTKK